jgi:hypothetical protein
MECASSENDLTENKEICYIIPEDFSTNMDYFFGKLKYFNIYSGYIINGNFSCHPLQKDVYRYNFNNIIGFIINATDFDNSIIQKTLEDELNKFYQIKHIFFNSKIDLDGIYKILNNNIFIYAFGICNRVYMTYDMYKKSFNEKPPSFAIKEIEFNSESIAMWDHVNKCLSSV